MIMYKKNNIWHTTILKATWVLLILVKNPFCKTRPNVTYLREDNHRVNSLFDLSWLNQWRLFQHIMMTFLHTMSGEYFTSNFSKSNSNTILLTKSYK